ncbi:TPA: thiamine kinase [Enterobacter chengduensis]|uniref:Thiamine kinase n=1 Tax=Enterobacter chengduensis TaxID=2494701 RepID=A0AAW3HH20_9ENTR|nr:thiamine kinase [Enterobacter chengduensis]KDF49567.1 thiamine kinase [Enterobacter cloacae BWH 43]OTW36268.1 thiamine kinase [Enterobacter kobei]GJL39912.1 thiamine kinase [Enterobacter asburiae]KJX36045.1 thiamine kinase [Enterobacter chengduensis]MBN9876396.1 thiamine kinase [Enterobacter chengduensis]
MRLRNNDSTRDEILTRYFPQYRLIAPQAHSGLGGASCIIAQGERRLVLRQHHDPDAPASHFRRQFRALKRLPSDLVPAPRFFNQGWMAVDYLDGDVKSALPDTSELAAMLYHLHRQPRLGWRITLSPLLERYWQQASPDRRTPAWLAHLRRLRKTGEPQPIRLAPLHMDVHAGNIVHTSAGIRLIDWEYAGDGDVALELAAVWSESDAARQTLIRNYAEVAHINVDALRRQVKRWRPWVVMLMAGWFEMRYRQSRDKQFIALADDAWRQLQTKG